MTTYVYLNEQGEPQATGPDIANWQQPIGDYYDRVDTSLHGFPEDGQNWDFSGNHWFYSKTALKVKAIEKRNTLISNGVVTYETYQFSVSDAHVLTMADLARFQDPTGTRAILHNISQNAIQLTNAQLVELASLLLSYRQSILDGEVSIISAIDGDTITTPSQIDDAFTSAISSPNSIDTVEDLFEFTEEVGSIPSTFDDLEDGDINKAFTSSEKTKLAGIASGATQNSSDSALLNRGNHSGTQSIGTIEGLSAALGEKHPLISPSSFVADAPTDAPTNAPADAATNYGVLAAILGADANATNGKQNTIAENVNSIASNVNSLATIVNSLKTAIVSAGLMEDGS